jgi:hypothetical protein
MTQTKHVTIVEALVIWFMHVLLRMTELVI